MTDMKAVDKADGVWRMEMADVILLTIECVRKIKQ